MNTKDQQKLLEKFSPNIRFTKGEAFFPFHVHPYLERCSLIAHYADGEEKELIAKGNLTKEELIKPRDLPKGTILHLRLTEDVNLKEAVTVANTVSSWKKRSHNTFVTGQGRLTRVGYISRIIDALFSLTLILRGRLPGLASNLAADAFIRDAKKHKEATYYGRVVETNDHGWIALQYWFFYYFNDWRSGFSGVNDHESDWEMATVYVYKDKKGNYIPEWVAYASHDYHGNDLRRHYRDDEQVQKVGNHPVIYAGVGSHASYFQKGEYLANFPIPTPRFLQSFFTTLVSFWNKRFHVRKERLRITIPFIDYARGDGLSVGHTEKIPVRIITISDKTDWVNEYKGLWGYYAQDPLSGEDAPAGPKYNRDGSVRLAWQNPFAFSGLDTVPVPTKAPSILKKEYTTLQKELQTKENNIHMIQQQLSRIAVRLDALKSIHGVEALRKKLTEQAQTLKKEQQNIYRAYSETLILYDAVKKKLYQVQNDTSPNMRGHIRNLATPTDIQTIRFARVAEIWASLSIVFIIFSLLLILVFFPGNLLLSFLITIYIFALLEAIIRKKYVKTLVGISWSLVFLAGVILFINLWPYILLGFLLVCAFYLLYENVKELRTVFSAEQ